MDKRIIAIALGCICAVGLILRLIPMDAVFGGSFTSFIETDSYSRMYYAQMIHGMPFLDGIVFTFQNNLLFSWIVSVTSYVMPIDIAGAILPPILGIGTVILVYLLASRLFNSAVGLLSAAFTAVIPSEFLHRTLLGFADHHALEVFLLVGALYCIVRAWQSNRAWRWMAGAGVVLLAYVVNWKSGLIIFGVFGVIAVLLFILRQRKAAVAMVVPVCIALAIYLPLGGYQFFMAYMPWVDTLPAAAQTGQEVVSTVASAGTSTISELQPLLFPNGTFTIAAVGTNLHLLSLVFLIGGYMLLRDKSVSASHKAIILVWSVFMLAAALMFRRNMYYFTINVAILSGYAVWRVAGYLKGKQAIQAMILAAPLIIVSLSLGSLMVKTPQYMMSEEWHSALQWMKTQQVSGHVTAWSDYGHWIKYVTGYEPNLLPGPGGTEVAQLYLSTDTDEARSLMDALDTEYLIVDTVLMDRKNGALVMIAGRQPMPFSDTLIYRLWYRNDPQPGLTLVYESETIKVFKRTG